MSPEQNFLSRESYRTNRSRLQNNSLAKKGLLLTCKLTRIIDRSISRLYYVIGFWVVAQCQFLLSFIFRHSLCLIFESLQAKPCCKIFQRTRKKMTFWISSISWYLSIRRTIVGMGYSRNKNSHRLWFSRVEDNWLILLALWYCICISMLFSFRYLLSVKPREGGKSYTDHVFLLPIMRLRSKLSCGLRRSCCFKYISESPRYVPCRKRSIFSRSPYEMLQEFDYVDVLLETFFMEDLLFPSTVILPWLHLDKQLRVTERRPVYCMLISIQ